MCVLFSGAVRHHQGFGLYTPDVWRELTATSELSSLLQPQILLQVPYYTASAALYLLVVSLPVAGTVRDCCLQQELGGYQVMLLTDCEGCANFYY